MKKGIWGGLVKLSKLGKWEILLVFSLFIDCFLEGKGSRLFAQPPSNTATTSIPPSVASQNPTSGSTSTPLLSISPQASTSPQASSNGVMSSTTNTQSNQMGKTTSTSISQKDNIQFSKFTQLGSQSGGLNPSNGGSNQSENDNNQTSPIIHPPTLDNTIPPQGIGTVPYTIDGQPPGNGLISPRDGEDSTSPFPSRNPGNKPSRSPLDYLTLPGGGLSPMMGAGFGKNTAGYFPYSFSYGATWAPNQAVTNQPGSHLGYVEQNFLLGMPIYRDTTNQWSLHLGVRNDSFNTNAYLVNSNRSFPAELWNINLGTSFSHRFENDWIAGGNLGIGSASDQPFHTINEVNPMVNAFLRIPASERNGWLFSLSYSPLSQIPIPIPGIAFQYFPTDNFRMNIGLPFSIWYRPNEDWTFDASYIPLFNVHARAMYRLADPVRIYTAFDWKSEAWFLADRPDINQKLFYLYKQLSTGMYFSLGPRTIIDLSGGYMFDRSFFSGVNVAQRNNDRLNIGSGAFLSLSGILRW